MEKRIQEARKCLDNGLYEAALALALTLPDICGQVEYPAIKKVGERYTKMILWILKSYMISSLMSLMILST